jgi:hypothetical protein
MKRSKCNMLHAAQSRHSEVCYVGACLSLRGPRSTLASHIARNMSLVNQLTTFMPNGCGNRAVHSHATYLFSANVSERSHQHHYMLLFSTGAQLWPFDPCALFIVISLRALTASASCVKTSTVVSHPMHASVMLIPIFNAAGPSLGTF